MNILIIGSENSMADYIKNFLMPQHNIFRLGEGCSFTSRVSTAKYISDLNPDAVISVHFLNDVDLCQQNESLAYKINAVASLNIAYACSTLDIPMLSLSTSHVYKADRDILYKETDECDPVNLYGKTMLAGEKLIKTLCRKYFILRTSWIFGGPDCIVKKILNNNDIPLLMCSEESGNPTYIRDICLAIKHLLNTQGYGVYNCASQNSVTKYTWIKEILKYAGMEKEVYEAPGSLFDFEAPRPKFAALDTSLLEEKMNLLLPDWRVSLIEYMSTIQITN